MEAAPAPPMPSTLPASSARDASWDSFEAFVGERSTGKPASDAKPPRGRDGMSIGQEEPPREAAKAPPVHEEREGRGKLIAGIAAAVILLAGAGYAGWRFSDSILALVNGTSSTSSQTAAKSPPAASQATQPASTKPGRKRNCARSDTCVNGAQKFTQRLMADGSEVDSGASGEQVASAAQAEGKSVANQNEKPPAQPAAAQTPAQPATTPAAASPTDAGSSQQAAPVKMFLYEERLGQASPTALEGTVTWSVKTDDQDGHKEKMIQGDISVPGRKMSAIFTLRKNNDPTLPASHIIELTFSLPKEFEGRGIENVLRISMKEKEQEQGDPLVAVPAKITDYFHMIALNAFADAVKNNLNLLKSRDWMDIPVTYSNGRRALLTLQKGPEGQKVFDEVISSWQANGDGGGPRFRQTAGSIRRGISAKRKPDKRKTGGRVFRRSCQLDVLLRPLRPRRRAAQRPARARSCERPPGLSRKRGLRSGERVRARRRTRPTALPASPDLQSAGALQNAALALVQNLQRTRQHRLAGIQFVLLDEHGFLAVVIVGEPILPLTGITIGRLDRRVQRRIAGEAAVHRDHVFFRHAELGGDFPHLLRLQVALFDRLQAALEAAQVEEQTLLIGGRAHLHERPRTQDIL